MGISLCPTTGEIMSRLQCSFCHKNQDEVKKLVSGPNNVHVCNECVVLCVEIICENTNKKESEDIITNIFYRIFGKRVNVTLAKASRRFPPGTTVVGMIAEWAKAEARQRSEKKKKLEKERSIQKQLNDA